MNQTSVRTGIMKVSIIGVLIMMACLALYYVMQVRQRQGIEVIAQNDRTNLANRIMDMYSRQYSNIVRDNSAWDEFINSFVGGHDEEWLHDNIGYMIDNYETSCVCVFDSAGAVAYQRKADECKGVEFFDFGGKTIPEILGGEPFASFFHKIGNTLYEYHGAGVVQASDMLTRNQKPQGYLFMVKKISYELLNEYQASIGNYAVGLVYNAEDLDLTKKYTFPHYLVTKPAKDHDGNTIAYIYFVFKNSVVKMYKRFIPVFVLTSLMCLLIMLAVLRYTTVKITRPLQNIADSFHTGKTDKILPLKKETNEFGVISGMMEEFFVQKDNLVKLNTDLKQSREEIMVQNEALQQQKEEIQAQHENVLMLNEELSSTNEDLAEQKKELQEAHDELTSSITYASRLQSAMLQAVAPNENFFKNYFITYYPKNIVGGDFYFARQVGDTLIVCVGDCTGHGVPGAMLASMGTSFLRQIISTTKEEDIISDAILNRLKKKVTSALGLDSEGEQRTDGMDVALLTYNKKTRNGYYSGAHRPMILIRDGELHTIKGDNIPIGHFIKEGDFTPVNIKFQPGDKIYMFSDGCTDQTGGPQRRRIMAPNFREHLLEYSTLPFDEQKAAIEDFIFTWKGDLQQTDDIVLMGFEIE